MKLGNTNQITVMGQTWTPKKLAEGEEIDPTRPTIKVVDTPIPGYWHRLRGAPRGIRRQYRWHLKRLRKDGRDDS
ncbi:MAG: hypothetical protein NWE89_13885 [Candidatus Bathyarchaeota archaeon]|nr:hypothetical protein [Candidatus Bathyarchaeota archaeon]